MPLLGTVAIVSGDPANAHGALVLLGTISPNAARTAVQKLRVGGGIECAYYDQASQTVTIISKHNIRKVLASLWSLLGLHGVPVVQARQLNP